MNKKKYELINSEGLLENRGEKLQVLSENANVLSKSSSNYYKSLNRVKKAECRRKVIIYGSISVLIIIIIVLILIF